MAKDLVQIIKENPNSTFIIDNDSWWMEGAETDEEGEPIVVAHSRDFDYDLPYGGSILIALAEIVGVKIESC